MEAFDMFAGEYFDFETFAGQGNDSVQLYQAYIEMSDIGDYPIRLRIGRQEMTYGREWLVGNNDAGVNFSGMAFDAVRLTYDYEDLLTVDAWWAKLVDLTTPARLMDRGSIEQDGDIDFYGLYATYKGVENVDIDAYLLYVRDSSSGSGFLGKDSNPDDTLGLYTVGARVAGALELGAGVLDGSLEGAFQFGDSAMGDNGDFGGWALNAMVGFEFADVAMSPRVELEYAYFTGDDDLRDEDQDAFVRLFSDVHYGELNLGQNFDAKATNMHILRLGVSAVPVEKLTVKADVYGFLLAEDDLGSRGLTFGIEQSPDLDLYGTDGFEDGEFDSPDNEVGWELDLSAIYQYTEDLTLRAGWAHFFVGEAFEHSYGFAGYTEGETVSVGEGVYKTPFTAQTNDDDIDYLYIEAKLVF
jgi:hypothetical protein